MFIENLQKKFVDYDNTNIDNNYDDNNNLSPIVIADLGKIPIFAV